MQIADKGAVQAARENPAIAKGINVMNGKVTHREVAAAFEYAYTPIDSILSG
jgi:alanine dehydrogenase